MLSNHILIIYKMSLVLIIFWGWDIFWLLWFYDKKYFSILDFLEI